MDVCVVDPAFEPAWDVLSAPFDEMSPSTMDLDFGLAQMSMDIPIQSFSLHEEVQMDVESQLFATTTSSSSHEEPLSSSDDSLQGRVLAIQPFSSADLLALNATDARPAKKRKRSEPEPEENPASGVIRVFLNRDELLSISSSEHEEFVKRHTAQCELNEEEREEVRRQRRLIKNREYAQSSRRKKKDEKAGSQNMLSSLLADNEALRSRVKNLEDENLRLKAALKDKVKKEQPTSSKTKPGVMFAVLLSVGLLFTVSGFLPSLPTANLPQGVKHTGRTLFSVPEPAPKSSSLRFRPQAFSLIPILNHLLRGRGLNASAPSMATYTITAPSSSVSAPPNQTTHSGCSSDNCVAA